MSLYERRAILLMPLGLLACGFTPVYAPGGTGAELRGKVEVNAPDDLDSFLMVQNLETRLGRSSDPAYRLAVAVATLDQGQAITVSGAITRYSIVGEADYTLVRAADDSIVASGSVNNFTGYSATGSTVDTLAAERDARERLILILANQIVTQLYALQDLAT